MRSLFKWMLVVPLLITYIFSSCALAILPVGRKQRRVFATRNTSLFSRIMLALFAVRVHAKSRDRLQQSHTGRLIVSNHLSYIDVLVISSLAPSSFITSVELGSTLFLGIMARLGGSLFVERRKAAGLKREIQDIAGVLADGLTVALFPEGTTFNGDKVHNFKNALFDAALTSDACILPLCLRYTKINDEPVNAGNGNSVYYYGGASFFQHVSRLFSLRSVDVEVLPLKIIRAHRHTTRKELATQAHRAISEAYHG